MPPGITAYDATGAVAAATTRRQAKIYVCAMKDQVWQAVRQAVVPVLTRTDIVLAPRGDWAEFPCSVRYYDTQIELQDATVLILQKDRVAAIRKNTLAAIAADWQCIYLNAVFVVFARSSRRFLDARRGWRSIYFGKVDRYLRSRALKERQSTIYYVHVPKTGGTSAWAALSNVFKSSVYYSNVHDLLANPPEPGEYDLVGLHCPPSALDGVLAKGDHVVGMLRHPTDRFVSGLLHSRRPHEDAETFSPSQKAMRVMRLVEFVRTEFGSYETRLQLITLGTDPRRALASYTDREMLDNALAFLERDDTIFAPSHHSGHLMEQLSQRLDFRAPRLRRLNASDPTDYARYRGEFQEAMPLIESSNAYDRQLYDVVCARFDGSGTQHAVRRPAHQAPSPVMASRSGAGFGAGTKKFSRN
jgi:hypothetical protein